MERKGVYGFISYLNEKSVISSNNRELFFEVSIFSTMQNSTAICILHFFKMFTTVDLKGNNTYFTDCKLQINFIKCSLRTGQKSKSDGGQFKIRGISNSI